MARTKSLAHAKSPSAATNRNRLRPKSLSPAKMAKVSLLSRQFWKAVCDSLISEVEASAASAASAAAPAPAVAAPAVVLFKNDRVTTLDIIKVAYHGVLNVLGGALSTAIGHSLPSFCLYAVVFHVTSVRATLMCGSIFIFSNLLGFWGLAVFGGLGPLVRFFAQREVYSFMVICCIISCLMGISAFLAGNALFDLGSGSVQLWSYVAQASHIDNATVVKLYKNVTSLAEDSYSKLETNYASEEWWVVVAGVRGSLYQGLEGTELLNKTVADLHTLYSVR